jgi:hypothetical protein
MGDGGILLRRNKMKIFHASPSLNLIRRYHELFPKDRLNLLLSLAFNEAEREGFLVQYRNFVAEIIGDSGAWSVAMGKSTLTLEAVINFLLLWGGKFDRYFNFDTDFSTRGFVNNIANQLAMEKEGLAPIPVVHNFYNFEIDYYVRSRKYDWLALGSSQSSNFRHIKHAVNRIKKGNPAIKIHWFGGSKYEWLIQLPIASCDTTSWAKTGAYGVIRYWNPHNEGLDKTDAIYVGGRTSEQDSSLHHFVTYPFRTDLEAYLLTNFGFRYADLSGYDDKINMMLVNMKYYTDLEQRINDERLRRDIPLE